MSDPSDTSPNRLSHLDPEGRAHMVDVSDKPISARVAIAAAEVIMQPETLRLIEAGALKKGDAISTARLAGIMAAKRTSELIPLCHPLALTHIEVAITLDSVRHAAHIRATVRTSGQTGVEMEALTAASVAALTIYDMAKAVDRGMIIQGVRLLEKHGGTHGDYSADAPAAQSPDAHTDELDEVE